MRRLAALLALAAALLASACDGAREDTAPAPAAETPALPPALPTDAKLPPQAGDFPALESRDCAEVAQFYVEALEAREFERAALVWDDPVIDGARLAALFDGYAAPRIEVGEPTVEGAAGSSYCTITGNLADGADPAKAPIAGELQLRRVNDVPGATPDQLRWTLRSSSFVEPMERSSRG